MRNIRMLKQIKGNKNIKKKRSVTAFQTQN